MRAAENHRGRRFGDQKGYLLLEVIIALFIFALIAYPLMEVFTGYYRASGKARGALVANHLAEKKMEEQLALGWQATTLPTTPSVVTYIKNGGEISVTYNLTVTVNDLSDTANPISMGLKQVIVQVEWGDSTGDKNLRLESLIYWGG